MWLAPAQKALNEVAEFDMRYAKKLYGGISGVSADQFSSKARLEAAAAPRAALRLQDPGRGAV